MERRKIKFRAFDEKEKVMSIQYSSDSSHLKNFIKYFGDKILMQFTGLLDRNGKEIYEGDIISYREHRKYLQSSFIGEVVWLDSHCAFGYIFNDENIIKTYPFNSIDEIQNDFLNHTEVIGNIYKNSDLIKNGNSGYFFNSLDGFLNHYGFDGLQK